MNDKLQNILIGMGSVLDIMPTEPVSLIPYPQKTDAENLADDWLQVGRDLRFAMNLVDDE